KADSQSIPLPIYCDLLSLGLSFLRERWEQELSGTWLCGFGRRFRGGRLLGFGRADPLLVVHGKEHIAAEAVAPMNAAAFQVVEDFRRGRKPHVHILLVEMHGAVFNSRVVCEQTNLRQWRNKVGFEAHDLVRVR